MSKFFDDKKMTLDIGKLLKDVANAAFPRDKRISGKVTTNKAKTEAMVLVKHGAVELTSIRIPLDAKTMDSAGGLCVTGFSKEGETKTLAQSQSVKFDIEVTDEQVSFLNPEITTSRGRPTGSTGADYTKAKPVRELATATAGASSGRTQPTSGRGFGSDKQHGYGTPGRERF